MSEENFEENVLGPITHIPPTSLIQSFGPDLSTSGQGLEVAANLRDRMTARTIVGEGCWEFKGAKGNKAGHRTIVVNGKIVRAHRIAWELANGRRVPRGLVVMHSCDNPACVNPAHLSVGTQKQNLHDSIRKGRYNTWGLQKLNAKQVREIRARAKAGERQKAIAKDYGIARNTVSAIVHRKTWAHLEDQ